MEAPERLVDILALEKIEEDIYRGRSPQENRQRVFGGQVAAQALVAAGRTVPADRPVHSLHSYFLRPGDPAVPIVYTVDRTRDGRSFTTRRVLGIQHGEVIFSLSASFQVVEPGLEHHDPMPAVPQPEDVPEWEPAESEVEMRRRPIELRPVGAAPFVRSGERERSDRLLLWMRARDTLPDDPLTHVCAVAYASDLTLLDAVLARHGRSMGAGVRGASLDHAMWFHSPFRADQWLLYVQESPAASGARGLAEGRIYRLDGTLVASAMQEGLLRIVG